MIWSWTRLRLSSCCFLATSGSSQAWPQPHPPAHPAPQPSSQPQPFPPFIPPLPALSACMAAAGPDIPFIIPLSFPPQGSPQLSQSPLPSLPSWRSRDDRRLRLRSLDRRRRPLLRDPRRDRRLEFRRLLLRLRLRELSRPPLDAALPASSAAWMPLPSAFAVHTACSPRPVRPFAVAKVCTAATPAGSRPFPIPFASSNASRPPLPFSDKTPLSAFMAAWCFAWSSSSCQSRLMSTFDLPLPLAAINAAVAGSTLSSPLPAPPDGLCMAWAH
mmetsp:Transcript_95208/g.218039  ORF Transcript_95208/g.218039 Transcript_95208/m.218039 type:complete len:273 (+) Transcript_95208:1686-2504(+)